MEVIIRSADVQQFMGIDHQYFEFGDSETYISAHNGYGKTTLATAFYWTMCDKNYALKSNPPVYPIGAEEAIPTVTLNLIVDGKPVKIKKIQSRKVGKPDEKGVSKISLSNSYEVNDVPKSERDFLKYMEEIGIKMDLFLPLSHPEVFTSQKAGDMRKVLFAMASQKSDLEIAQMTDGCKDLPALLTNYSTEEVTAMQKASLRKINEDYGRSGEILTAKINGLEMAKSHLDITGLPEKKTSLQFARQQLIDEQNTPSAGDIARKEIENRIASKQADLSKIINTIESTYNQEKWKLNSQKVNTQNAIGTLQYSIDSRKKQCSRNDETIKFDQGEFEKQKKLYEEEKSLVWDETCELCPTCGQKLPDYRITDLKMRYENNRKMHMDTINHKAKDIQTEIKNLAAKNAQLIQANKEDGEKLDAAKKQLADIEEQIAQIQSVEDSLADNKEYQALSGEVASLQLQLTQMDKDQAPVVDNSAKIAEIDSQIAAIDKQIAAVANNSRIDAQIAQLRDDQKNYEQQRADAEKILHELDLLSRAKNALLTDEINSHFKLVKFKLFDYLKNGSYIEVCIPTIDGKRFGTSANAALELRGKLDIIDGLSDYYGQWWPIFIDNAEKLDTESKEKISETSHNQMIFLSVADTPWNAIMI